MSQVNPEVLELIDDCMSRPNGGTFVEQSRQMLRQRCKDDPWFLIYYVLGYKDIDTTLHRDMLERWVKRRHRLYGLYQVPRGHLKTSLWTIGTSIWEALLDPNLRILIINAVYSNAQDMMAEIRVHLETNDIFRWLFPEYCIDLCSDVHKAKLCKATADRIDFPCGNRMGRREGNIECLGVEMSLVSKHYDLMVFDDLVNDVNTATKEYRDKVWKWFLNSWQLRHSPIESRIRDIGTPWHMDDVHARIIRKEKERRAAGRPAQWLIYRRSVTETSSYSDDRLPIWPERFTSNVLVELRENLGSYIYACQYECNPISPENALFQHEQIQLIDDDDVPLNVLNFAAVDLAEEGSDYTAITVASIDTDGRMYVRQVFVDHVSPLDLIDMVRSLVKIWDLRGVAIETVGFQKTILKFYKDYSTEKNFYIPWREVKRHATHKIRRFLALQPTVERGYFYVVRDITNRDKLIDQMTTVSVDHLPTHDDILDNLADIHFINYTAPTEEQIEVAPPGSLDDVFGSLEWDDEDFGDDDVSNIGREFWRSACLG